MLTRQVIFKNGGEGEVDTQVYEFSKLDEIFEDNDGDIFDIVLSFGMVHESNNRIKYLKEHGIDLHDIHKSHFHHFYQTKPFIFLYFVSWCASNYSQYEHVIMESN